MELKQDDWDSNKSCSQIIRDCLAPVLSRAGGGWWPGLESLTAAVFLPRVPGYLLFFSDPSQLATKVREADLFSAAQPIFLCLARVQKSPHKFMLTSYMKYLVNTSRRFATSSSVQCLPGDRVMTPPLHCPTDTQDTATTALVSLIARVWTIFREGAY